MRDWSIDLPGRFSRRDDLTRWSYRLRDESPDGAVESVHGFVIGDARHLQTAVYFDDPAAAGEARAVIARVVARGGV